MNKEEIKTYSPEDLKQMSDSEFLGWLARNSRNPELYISRLPKGMEFIGIGQGVNCFDYALGLKGCGWFEPEFLKRAWPWPKAGNLILYYDIFDDLDTWDHAGIYMGKNVVESQWGKKVQPSFVTKFRKYLKGIMGTVIDFTKCQN